MSENVETLEAKIADLEKRVIELDSENRKLRQTLDEATKTLQVYVDREKEAAITAIMEKANWDKEELEKLDLPSLRLILKAVDSVKGTVKSIRSVATSETKAKDGRLTVGCLYHKPLESGD
jgi:predicted RNase H-like nuclease (RuvC/YqgF family)